ncbi:MAG: hypothetical protein IMZ46_14095, partial [Acidobacteria bacterium]|nr:hypothetical protein [Acidobacteriota bacterium]
MTISHLLGFCRRLGGFRGGWRLIALSLATNTEHLAGRPRDLPGCLIRFLALNHFALDDVLLQGFSQIVHADFGIREPAHLPARSLKHGIRQEDGCQVKAVRGLKLVTMGSAVPPAIACNCDSTPGSSFGPCSVSTRIQSNP